MWTLSISKNWQDYIMAVVSALIGVLTLYSQAPYPITVPAIIGVIVVILNAVVDVNKKQTVTPLRLTPPYL